MATKTVRILRTLPLEGALYRANDLVAFEADLLKVLPKDAYDSAKAAVDYCKFEGVEVIEHGAQVDPVPAESGAGSSDAGDSDAGEIVE